MLSWATQKIEKLSEAVAPPPTDASSRFVYCMQRHDEQGALQALQEIPDPANTVVQQTKGATALHVACQASSANVIRTILMQPGASLFVLDSTGNSPLHYAAMSSHPEALPVVKMLVTEFRASVVSKNGEGKTPYDMAEADRVRQYLLPLQLQQETQHALDNGGPLPPGTDFGGMARPQTTGPPPPIVPSTPAYQQQQASMLTTPSPTSMPASQSSGFQSSTSPASSATRPPMAPSSGNREYARSGSSSAATYKGGIQPDGFHSSSSDRNLQKLYGHSNVSASVNVAPPPTSSGSAPMESNPYSMRRSNRYPVYDALSGRTVTPPHSGSFAGTTPQAPYSAPVVAPHSGSVFNPVAGVAVPQQPVAPALSPLQQSSPGMATPALPEGWTEAVDPSSGRTYYVNAAQNTTTWERPVATVPPKSSTPTLSRKSIPAAPVSGASSVQSAEELFAGPTPEKQVEEEKSSGWKEIVDPSSGKTYYFNEATNETTWEKPLDFKAQEEPAKVPNASEVFGTPSPKKQVAESKPEEKQEPTAPTQEAPSVLPDGWSEVVDPNSSKSYYFNAKTNETTWNKPETEPIIEQSAGEVFAAPSPEKQTEKPSKDVITEPEQKEASEPAKDLNGHGNQIAVDAASDSLPEGWAEVIDPNSGRTYYVNTTTNETTWDKPKPVAPVETAAPEKQSDIAEEPTDDLTTEKAKDLNGLGNEDVAKAKKNETPAPRALPEGWAEVVDPNSGRTYYFNAATNETTWEKPQPPVESVSTDTRSADDVFGAPSPEKQGPVAEAKEDSTTEPEPAKDLNANESEGKAQENADHVSNALPEGWTEVVDPNSGRSYFVNTTTNETTWERPAASTPLPEGWTEAVDPSSGRTYYHNTAQNVTTWERPKAEAVKETEPQAAPKSAEDVFSSPSDQQVDTQQPSEQPVSEVPAQEPIAHVQSVDSTASAEDVFAAPAEENRNGKQPEKPAMPESRSLTEETANTSSSSAAGVLSAPAGDSSKEPPGEKPEVVSNGGVETEEEVMSEVPLDENLAPVEPSEEAVPGQAAPKETEGESLFAAIGLPPPPFRSS